MQKNIIVSFLLLFNVICIAQQNHSVIKGNIGVKNVNISIINTGFGVSSNDKGNFIMMLPKSENKVGLLFTCIGYQDTLVNVIPNQDTIELNFKMQEMTYMLDEVGIGSEKIKRYSEPSYVMLDFEIYDNMVFVLQRKGNTLKECRILINDLWLDPIDTISIPRYIEPEKIIIDCTESCQLIGKDSVYQVVKMNDIYKLMFPTEKERYDKVLKNIIFFTEKYIYFNELQMGGYISKFFRIKKKTKEYEMLFVSDDMKTYRNIKKEKQWHIEHPMLGGSPSAEDWERFVQLTWFHTKDNCLYIFDGTLYYFDHLNGKILRYDEGMYKLGECEITYPTKENFWHYKIYKDKAFGKFYTIFGTEVNEIDVITGKTNVVANVDSFISEKMVIYKGCIYIVTKKRNVLHEFESYIERIEL